MLHLSLVPSLTHCLEMMEFLFYFEDSGEASHYGQAKTSGFGNTGTGTLYDWSCPSHVTILQKKASLYVSCMHVCIYELWLPTVVLADLVVSASSCCAVKFCISTCYYCLHVQEERYYSVNCESFRAQRQKTFVCRFRSVLIDLNEKVRPHVEGMTTMRMPVDVFTKLICILLLK